MPRPALSDTFWPLPPQQPQTIQAPFEEVEALLNRTAVWVGRWGYKKGALSEDDHRRILDEEAAPALERILEYNRREKLFIPRGAAVWLPCCVRDAHTLDVFPAGRDAAPHTLVFPDLPEEGGGIPLLLLDENAYIGAFAVTVADDRNAAFLHDLQEAGKYQDYLYWNGFAAEWTDAMAGWLHRKMTGRAPAAPLPQKRIRFAPGYPSCPDLQMNRLIAHWTHAGDIGIRVLPSGMMEPEFTTTAFVLPV